MKTFAEFSKKNFLLIIVENTLILEFRKFYSYGSLHMSYWRTCNIRYCFVRTFLAANRSGLPSIPIENVWMGYLIPISLAFLTNNAATKLESRPPRMDMSSYLRNSECHYFMYSRTGRSWKGGGAQPQKGRGRTKMLSKWRRNQKN